jgi:hypothetical protein
MASRIAAASATAVTYIFLWARIFAVLLGAVAAYGARFDMNPDGVSYLDLGDAVVRDGLGAAVNGYWSPLFPSLWGLLNAVVQPDPSWEYPLAHALIFATYLAYLAAVEYLCRTIELVRDGAGTSWPWVVLVYSFAVWGGAALIGLKLVTPDLLLTALMLTAAALSLRVAHGYGGTGASVALGATLALGYLTKSVMLPIGVVLVAAIPLAAPRPRRVTRPVLLAGVVFAVLCFPLIAALSVEQGRLTMGESGRLNAAWYASDATPPWISYAAVSTAPQRLSAVPAAFAFGTAVGGTYPMWYDASYWYAGLELRPTLANLARRVLDNGPATAAVLAWPATVLLLLALHWRPVRAARAIRPYTPLVLTGLAGIGMYQVILILPRYIAGFTILVFLGTGAALVGRSSPRMLQWIAVLMTVVLVGPSTRDAVRSAAGTPVAMRNIGIVSELARARVARGTPVAFIGYGFGAAAWARLAGLRIVAEVPELEAGRFWAASRERRRSVLAAFGAVGARIVFAERPSAGAVDGTWSPLGTTGLYFQRISAHPPTARAVP